MYLRMNHNQDYDIEVKEYHVQHVSNEDGKQQIGVYVSNLSDIEVLTAFSKNHSGINNLELLEIDGSHVRSLVLTNGKLKDIYERYYPGYQSEYVAIIEADAIVSDTSGMMQ